MINSKRLYTGYSIEYASGYDLDTTQLNNEETLNEDDFDVLGITEDELDL
jgi:hypothetical protein